WGDEFDSTKVNTSKGDNVGQTTAVGLYPSGRNKELELYTLSGNVWEWQRNKYDNPEDEQIDDSNAWRVLRGGSWVSFARSARAAARGDYTPDSLYDSIGFRVAARRSPSHLGL
ncbi:MAG: formylglycine-generating enzyme family protein, partial [Chloroflexi bacterium]|nr:formylglycine-generating enzyme family protein [Chloroflexota bacterium]